jgi:hypothetical protein
LEEVGELEGADVATLSADFTLEVENEAAQVLRGVAGAQDLKPHALAVEAQAQVLASQPAVELVGLGDGGSGDPAGRGLG